MLTEIQSKPSFNFPSSEKLLIVPNVDVRILKDYSAANEKDQSHPLASVNDMELE